MAHIIMRGQPGGVQQLIIDDVDFTMEVYGGGGYPVRPELVVVGEGEQAEVGLRVTFAVSRLDLDAETDVRITDNFRSVAQRVQSMQGCDDADAC